MKRFRLHTFLNPEYADARAVMHKQRPGLEPGPRATKTRLENGPGSRIGADLRSACPGITLLCAAAVCLTLFGAATPAAAFEANDQLEVNVLGAGAVQCLDLDNAGNDGCEGALALQGEISLKPLKNGELFAKVGFAEGNALGSVSPFALSAWAADLEGDLENINGRSRDHLLTAWYRHQFKLAEDAAIAATGGIIDSTDYLDDNAFANDEFGQFLNEVFVNAPTANLASYDKGAVGELDVGPVSLRGVIMEVGANDDGNKYNFYGGQAAITTKTRLGEGTYRVVVTGTDSQFLDPTGTRLEALTSVTLSLDQQLGEHVGVFARFGWQDDDAAVTHDALYSGGVALSGGLWGRDKDTIGLAFAHLEGGNGALQQTQVFEAYYRLGLGDHFAVTADVQHMSDEVRGMNGPEGTIFSLRGTAEF